MLDLFKSLAKLFRVKRIHIEGPIFRLHSTLTVILLLIFTIASSARQILGDPMYCDVDRRSVDVNVVNHYCYINSTYSIVEPSSVYPGLGHARPEYRTYQTYYQWVGVVLFIQAVFFYFPRWLWKSYESERMSSLVHKLDYFTDKPEDREEKERLIAEFLFKTNGTNNLYVIKYFLCELLVYLNCLVQIAIMDLFLRGHFITLWFDWIVFQLDTVMIYNPLTRVFPLLSQCNFHRYGISGTTEAIEMLCILPNNLFNQFIFLILSFWYLFLAIITINVFIYRLILIFCPLMRYQCCRHRFDFYKNDSFRVHDLVINKLYLGEWFILYMLSYNTELIVFSEILEKICDEFNIESKNKSTDSEEKVLEV